MSDESKVGTIERDTRGNVTIFAPSAAVRGAAPVPGGASRSTPAEEQPSQILQRIIRHVNGLAVALETLRLKLESQEKRKE